jgi:hypothetical protein
VSHAYPPCCAEQNICNGVGACTQATLGCSANTHVCDLCVSGCTPCPPCSPAINVDGHTCVLHCQRGAMIK